MGKLVRHEIGERLVVRLFKKGCARFTEALVHESLVVEGKVGDLHSVMHHDTV